MKRKVSIVTAWTIARSMAETTIDILDIYRFDNLFERFAKGELANFLRVPLKLSNGPLVWKSYRLNSFDDSYDLNITQREEIFGQAIHLVWIHFGYKREPVRLRDNNCPFLTNDGLNKVYFSDKAFNFAERFEINSETMYLKSFPIRNYYKPLLRQKRIILEQAKNISFRAATSVAWELYQQSIIHEEEGLPPIDFNQDDEIAIKDFLADEVAWYLYKHYTRDYTFNSKQFNNLISQSLELLSKHPDDLVNIKGAELDLKRSDYKLSQSGHNRVPPLNPRPEYERFEFIVLDEFK